MNSRQLSERNSRGLPYRATSRSSVSMIPRAPIESSTMFRTRDLAAARGARLNEVIGSDVIRTARGEVSGGTGLAARRLRAERRRATRFRRHLEAVLAKQRPHRGPCLLRDLPSLTRARYRRVRPRARQPATV